jgi:organic radical activating enzyme
MKFIELSVLTMVKPIDGKGESSTSYLKQLVNADKIISAMDDPKKKDLMHVVLVGGERLLVNSTLKKFKALIKG